MPANSIKFIGGVALLVSGVTGPTIAVIPQLFQQAGWLTPTLAFMLVSILSGSAALFLVESMASISGNDDFKAKIEYSTLAELFLGHRWHWALQVVLYIALQSQALTSLIESFQSMDTLLVTVAHKSCAISFKRGWECVSTIPENGLGVFSDYIFISFGYLITLALVLPLCLIQLSDNIKYQIVSFITLLFICTVWIVTFFQVGITNNPIPVVASNQGTVVGYVISNFAFVTTIPAFVNNIHPSTNIHRVIWLSIIISCTIYLSIGFTGAAAFKTPPNSTILAVVSARRPSLVALISVYVFPIAVLITSIPVFMIVIRYNLLRGNICTKPWAIFFSSILPWIIVIPFQTNGWLTIVMNWTSLFFSSIANLVIPFILYLLSKRYHASAALDLYQEHDEFRLRPINSPFPITSPTHLPNTTPTTSPTNRPRIQITIPTDDLFTTGESTDTVHLLPDTSTAPGSANVIRLIRSPSIHRYYGETPESLGTGRSQAERKSVSYSAGPGTEGEGEQGDGEGDGEGEKNKVGSDGERPGLTLDMPRDRVSLTVPTTTTGTGQCASSAVDVYSSTITPSPTRSLRRTSSVPDIKVEIEMEAPGLSPRQGSGTLVRRSLERSALDGVEREGNIDHDQDNERDKEGQAQRVREGESVRENRRSRLNLARSLAWPLRSLRARVEAFFSSLRLHLWLRSRSEGPGEQDMDDVGPREAGRADDGDVGVGRTHRGRPFEAFPTLNRRPWFNSVKVAVAFCALTSVLVAVNIVYNIVLAAKGSGQ